MDTLHTMLRAIRGETKAQRRDHLTVFREFLSNLDRIGRRGAPPSLRAVKGGKIEPRRGVSRSR